MEKDFEKIEGRSLEWAWKQTCSQASNHSSQKNYGLWHWHCLKPVLQVERVRKWKSRELNELRFPLIKNLREFTILQQVFKIFYITNCIAESTESTESRLILTRAFQIRQLVRDREVTIKHVEGIHQIPGYWSD